MMLDGDAPLAGVAGLGNPRKRGHPDQNLQQLQPPASGVALVPPNTPAPRLKKVPNPPQHNTGSDGQLTTNRRGVHLCRNFQKGNCQTGTNMRCSADPELAHQCGKCLSHEHGAEQCNKPAAATPKGRGRGGGAPKGGRGGKGRGGGRGRK
jgi:hypothetical protein